LGSPRAFQGSSRAKGLGVPLEHRFRGRQVRRKLPGDVLRVLPSLRSGPPVGLEPRRERVQRVDQLAEMVARAVRLGVVAPGGTSNELHTCSSPYLHPMGE
jgi:hypothetical protein